MEAYGRWKSPRGSMICVRALRKTKFVITVETSRKTWLFYFHSQTIVEISAPWQQEILIIIFKQKHVLTQRAGEDYSGPATAKTYTSVWLEFTLTCLQNV